MALRWVRILGAGFLASAACLAGTVADAEAESPDAGDTITTAIPAHGQTTITGTLETLTDVDLYWICIDDPATFGVTVDAVGTSSDPDGQLFLFDRTGRGKLADDDSGSLFLPAFPAGDPWVAALAPGEYLLGLSNFNVDPTTAAGEAIFSSGSLRPPYAWVEDEPLAGWDGFPTSRSITDYTLTLTGVSCSEPGDTAATAGVAYGQTTITGVLHTPDDVDVFRICIDDPAWFTATVTADGPEPDPDSQLFLFDAAGRGKLADDDTGPDELPMLASNWMVITSGPGEYLLAVSNFDRDPVTAANQEIFPDGSPSDPFAGLEDEPFVGWNGASGPNPMSAYTLTLTGAGCPWPTVAPVSGITVTATSPAGASPTFTPPSATDFRGAPLAVTCDPASGSEFPVGTTTVTCEATDLVGQTGSVAFDVTVLNTAPALGPLEDVTLVATGPDGAVVTFEATAEDEQEGALEPECTPPSGSTFPVGTTTVTCEVVDANGGTDAASFEVTVLNTAPVLGPLEDVTVVATGPDGAVVTFEATAEDEQEGVLEPECTPPSGSTFPVGTTTVTCEVTDANGGFASGSFVVTVTPAPPPPSTSTTTTPPGSTTSPAPPAASPGALARTGVDSGRTGSLAILLVSGGIVLVALRRSAFARHG